jgi:hypothetical protein
VSSGKSPWVSQNDLECFSIDYNTNFNYQICPSYNRFVMLYLSLTLDLHLQLWPNSGMPHAYLRKEPPHYPIKPQQRRGHVRRFSAKCVPNPASSRASSFTTP